MTPFWTFFIILLALTGTAIILYNYYPIILAIPHKEWILFVVLVVAGVIGVAYHMMPDQRPMDRYQGESTGVPIPSFECG